MRIASIILLMTVAVQPAVAQGFAEAGSVRALSAGLGAGLAGSLGHGRVVEQSYETMLEAQQAAAMQTKEIQVYFAQALQFEKSKQWSYAETTLGYVLRMIARRDGPGSPNSLPVLSHLSHIARSEKKLDQAIGYQKTVVALTQAAKKPDPNAMLTEQRTLSGLYVEKKDYGNAQVALRAEAGLFDRFPTLPRDQYAVTMSVYGKILQALHQGGDTGSIGPMSSQPEPSQGVVQGETVTRTVAPAAEPSAVAVQSPAEATPQPRQFDFPDRAEATTPDQAALQKVNLAGSQPLPSELDMVQTMVAMQQLTAAQEIALMANVPGLRSSTLQSISATSMKDTAGRPPDSGATPTNGGTNAP